ETLTFDEAVQELISRKDLTKAELKKPGFMDELRAAWNEAKPMQALGQYVEVKPGWAAVKGGCKDGCEAAAEQIQTMIGGEVHTIKPPPDVDFLGKFDEVPRRWQHHRVVVKDGRVYDMSTGYRGVSI